MEEIIKRYKSAYTKIESALYKVIEKDGETTNEELLKALDEIIILREHIGSVKGLREIQLYLKQIEDSIIESIEIEDLEKKMRKIRKIEEMYKKTLGKIENYLQKQ